MIKFIEIDDNEWMIEDSSESLDDFDIIEEAMCLWEENQDALAKRKLKDLITKKPTNIDAYLNLASIFENNGDEKEAISYSQKAADIGLKALPKKFSWKTANLNWYIHENRPFLRAYHNLGLWYQQQEKLDKALEVFSNLISVCPTDNLGSRTLIPSLLFEKKDYSAIIKLCENFIEDELTPEISYSHPLALIYLDEIEKAKPLIKQAQDNLPLVAKELLKKRHKKPKTEMEGYIAIGGHEQAYLYWQNHGKYWSNNPHALEIMTNNK
jgi:tetratricopeptide (TPR) repeat protein